MKQAKREIVLYMVKAGGNLLLTDNRPAPENEAFATIRGRVFFNNISQTFSLDALGAEYHIDPDSSFSFAPVLFAAAKKKSVLQVFGLINRV